MNKLDLPEFKTYEEEAAFWDNLDTSDFMGDDGEWFQFETTSKRAVLLPSTRGEENWPNAHARKSFHRNPRQCILDRTHTRDRLTNNSSSKLT